MPKRGLMAAGLALMALAAGGCGYEYRKSIETIAAPYQTGQYAAAADRATDVATQASARDKLVLLLEQGCTLRAAGRIDESNKALNDADRLFDEHDRSAKLRLDREAASVFASPAALIYEGYGYDRIMMNAYKVLNSLEAGHLDEARIEIKRLSTAQQKCEERYRDQISQAESARRDTASATRYPVEPDRVKADPAVARGQRDMLADFPQVQGDPGVEDLSHKALYSNAFAEYLQGVFYLYSGAPGERELARVSFRNAAGMMPGNAFAAQDAQVAEQAANFAAIQPKTYVFFETGMAPRREEVQILIPVVVPNGAARGINAAAIAIAFPKLKKNPMPWDATLAVSSAQGTIQTQVLADVDQIVAREFKNELPLLLTRAATGAVTKAVIQYGVARATEKQEQVLRSVLQGLATFYTAATNEADLRTWRTLPQQVQIASLPTPADGKINLRFASGLSSAVAVKPGKANIIWVRRPSSAAAPQIRSFAIN
jgi:hypothetical protein